MGEQARVIARQSRSNLVLKNEIASLPLVARNDGISWMIIAGLTILGILLALAIFAPWLAPSDPGEIRLAEALEAPSAAHPLGTDQLGRDLLSRMMFGARVSLSVGFVAVGLAVGVGVLVGLIAGYWGGWVDDLLMRGVDIMLCFPDIFLILAAVAFLGPSMLNIMVIIGLTGWMGVARLVRAEVLSLRSRDFILAAQVIGAAPARILFKHLLPNAMAPVIVSATLGVGSAVLLESALSFLGIGIQPPIPSWGNILSEGKETLGVAWWLTLFPGFSIFTVVLGCNLLGEGFRRRWRQ